MYEINKKNCHHDVQTRQIPDEFLSSEDTTCDNIDILINILNANIIK